MHNIFRESSCADLDLFREQSGPLQMEILQLETGRFNAAQQIVDFGDISFCLTYYALRLTTRIEMASGHVTLALPFTEASWCGEYFPQHCAAVVLPNHQSTTVLASNFVAVHGGRVSNSMVSIDFGNFSLANLTQGTNMLYR